MMCPAARGAVERGLVAWGRRVGTVNDGGHLDLDRFGNPAIDLCGYTNSRIALEPRLRGEGRLRPRPSSARQHPARPRFHGRGVDRLPLARPEEKEGKGGRGGGPARRPPARREDGKERGGRPGAGSSSTTVWPRDLGRRPSEPYDVALMRRSSEAATNKESRVCAQSPAAVAQAFPCACFNAGSKTGDDIVRPCRAVLVQSGKWAVFDGEGVRPKGIHPGWGRRGPQRKEKRERMARPRLNGLGGEDRQPRDPVRLDAGAGHSRCEFRILR